MSVSKTSKSSSTVRAALEAEAPEEEFRFLTGCTLLDRMVGGGVGDGFPAGKIINLVGDKSSGKTFLACEIAAAARHKYGKRVQLRYDDCESGFSFNTKALYGVEIVPADPADRKRSETVEDLYCNVRDFLEALKPDQIGIYITDSLDGLSSKEGNDLADERFAKHKKGEEFDKGSYKMGKAKYLSQEFFPGLAGLLESKRCLLVVISQVRENVDPMSFEKYVRAGGKALDFYCHTVLWLANLQKIKRKERAVGVVVRAKATKSKTPRPYREMTFSLLFDYGLDDIGTSIDFLYDFRTDTGKLVSKAAGTWGEPVTKEAVLAFLEERGEKPDGRTKFADLLESLEEKGGETWKAYQERFGAVMSRDELIAFVEEHGKKGELAQKAVEKWETLEAAVRTNRPPKYA